MTKRLILLPLVIVVSMSFFSASVAAQSTPEKAAKDFYKWYFTELNASREPIRQSKPKMLKAISSRLARWAYSPAYSEYGADYFIDAQDYDEDWANGVSSTAAVIKGSVATLNIILYPKKGSTSGFGKRTLKLKMVREVGLWKIDSVNNRKLTK